MLTLFFFLTTIICAFRWLNNKLALMTIVTYMEKKGYRPPSDEEIKTCREFVASHIAEDIHKKIS